MRIGIICAIPNELRYFKFTENSIQEIAGRKFYKSTQNNHELFLVQSGLGKVNAAIVSTLLVEKFKCEFLLLYGIAGGIDPRIEIGDVIIGESLIQYDYGTIINREMVTFRPGSIPISKQNNKLEYSLDPKIKSKLKSSLPNVLMGKFITGDVFLQCKDTKNKLFIKFGAQAIDMEGGAVAQVAEQFGIPAVVVRCLSDLAGTDSKILSSKFQNKAAKISANTVQKILKILF